MIIEVNGIEFEVEKEKLENEKKEVLKNFGEDKKVIREQLDYSLNKVEGKSKFISKCAAPMIAALTELVEEK